MEGSSNGERGSASVIGVEPSVDRGTRGSFAEKPCGKCVFRFDNVLAVRDGG